MTGTDLELVRMARRGDRRALEVLYDRHKGRLLGYCDKMLGSHAAAEDVFQDVWIKMMRALPGYRPTAGSFRPWLFRIAANTAVDRIRRDRLRDGPELDADQVARDAPTPESEGIGREIGRDLDTALAELPERQRNAVLLRHQLGMSYAEISTTLKVPEGTAKTLVHRGAHALRKKLAVWSRDEP